MNAGSTQLKEFLTVYNTLTDSCFRACIREFNHHQLIQSEAESPANLMDYISKLENDPVESTRWSGHTSSYLNGIDKHMRTSQRLMLIFAEQAPNKLFKKEESSK
ncbi:hypothetical protein WUBG_04213 [Wuchereria bancrofti]|uniref:Mitochondrial import inner membrane translocase subunit n=1 Tax=Wuchereria bancrofti TaxID=6293 RepID=J9ERR0_WUCBA|nr:hypothetical protein WUBG_04213 [Wuchereria bancrofti]